MKLQEVLKSYTSDSVRVIQDKGHVYIIDPKHLRLETVDFNSKTTAIYKGNGKYVHS